MMHKLLLPGTMLITTLEPPPLRVLARQSFHPWLIVGVTCIGAFVGQLDASIVQLALPALTHAFGATVNEVRWVAIAYLVAFAGSLGVFGRVCDMFGRKVLYLGGFALFTGASLLCGDADNLGVLIACRALQGVGGGLLGANSMAILVKSVPADKRARAIGLFTAAQAVGVSAGPIVGGLLLDALGWRWIFWVALPFGVSAFVLGWLVLPRSTDRPADTTFDWAGAVLLVPSLVLAILALNQVSVWSLHSPAMILCIGSSVVLLAVFVRQEKRAAAPLVDLKLFCNRAFSAGIAGVALGYALLYGMLFLMAFALQKGLDNSATVAGLKLAVIPVVLGLAAPIGTSLAERSSSRRVGTAGMAACLAAVAALALIAFGPDRLVVRLCALALFGLGLGLFMAPNSHATIEAAPADRAATAGALVNLARVFGSCIGISATSSMMAWQLGRLSGEDLMSPMFVVAVESSLLILAAFALIAGAALRFLSSGPRPSSPPREHPGGRP
ncbi:MAG: DHA2 family efflux MFS transporter permease subunit [Enhydrobacter sp.]|nr:DHA2 family efflux MFS transporter permease subunit [Enhydrobacter sp.]